MTMGALKYGPVRIGVAMFVVIIAASARTLNCDLDVVAAVVV